MNVQNILALIKLQRLIKSKKKVTEESISKIIQFPYKIDTFQFEAIKSIEKGQHVLVTAHTSAGKSTIAEYSIAKCATLNQKVIYTSPIKTLSNQKYYDLRQKCSTILNMDPSSIGISTGDIKINPDTAQCIIMTTEILRNKLYKDIKFFDDVKIVVFDEVHYIKDMDRGHVWEESIIMLPNHVTIVMLSATISNPEDFAHWVQKIKGVKTNLVSTLYRPVPLSFYFYAKQQIYPMKTKEQKIDYDNYDIVKDYFFKFFKEKRSYKSLFNEICQYIYDQNLMPAILFNFSRKNCEAYSKYITINLINYQERSEIERIFNFYTSKGMSEIDRYLPQTLLIKENLLKGIGIHHSGLLPLLKEIVEIVFGKGLIKLLFATETFAVGVNMPTKTVIFTELEKYDNYHGRRNLFTDEFLQMSGRAGRRGLDTKGTVIYLPIKPMLEKNELSALVLGNTPKVLSRFILDHRLLLKSIESPEQDTYHIVANSLLSHETEVYIKANQYDLVHFQQDLESSGKSFNLSVENYKIVSDYLKLEEDQNKIKKKPQKLQAIKNQWTGTDSVFQQSLKQLKHHQELQDKIINLEHDIKYLKNSAAEEIFKNIRFLKSLGFITYSDIYHINCYNSRFFIKTLDINNLTPKGIICSQLNECNSLVMSQLIDQHIFDSSSLLEIIVILALFIDEGNKKEEDYLSDKELPKEIKQKIRQLININQNLEQQISQFQIYHTFEFNYSFVEYACEWAKGLHLRQIYENKEDKIYEGNFIKNIIKINNMAIELMEALKMINQFELAYKFEQIEPLIIRDLVNSKSIYLN